MSNPIESTNTDAALHDQPLNDYRCPKCRVANTQLNSDEEAQLDRILRAPGSSVWVGEPPHVTSYYSGDYKRIKAELQALIATRVAEARKAQDNYSRADEFLWFRRKLKEFMPQKIQARYKGFLDNFVEPHAAEYLEKMSEYEAALTQLAPPNYKEK